MQRRNQVVKYNLAGRVMIDPATFRRINANYPVSTPKADDKDILSDSDDDSESSDDDEAQGKRGRQSSDDEKDDKKKKRQSKPKRKLVKDPDEESPMVPGMQAAGYHLRVRERGHRMFRTPERDVHGATRETGVSPPTPGLWASPRGDSAG